MKRIISPVLLLVAAFFIFSGSAAAQRNIEQKVDVDSAMEQDAKHNLEVAWQYFKLKKAYIAVLDRYEETVATYPEFSKIDEFLYLAGMSSYYLAVNKGKQKIEFAAEKDKEKYTPEKLREDAVAYLSLMLEKNPDSKYKNDAEKVLKEFKAK